MGASLIHLSTLDPRLSTLDTVFVSIIFVLSVFFDVYGIQKHLKLLKHLNYHFP